MIVKPLDQLADLDDDPSTGYKTAPDGKIFSFFRGKYHLVDKTQLISNALIYCDCDCKFRMSGTVGYDHTVSVDDLCSAFKPHFVLDKPR